MMRHIRQHIHALIASAALMGGAAAMTGCSNEEIDAPRSVESATPGTQLVINLAVPQSMETSTDTGTRADGPEMTPTADETRINSLRLIAFSTNGTPVVNRALIIPSEMPLSPQKTAIYEIRDILPGDYRIYLVANLEDYVASISSEQALRDVIINLDGDNELRAGNLPMVYEPSAAVTIPSSATTNPAVATLSFKFACVKVKYDLLFDKTFNQDIFGDNGMVINSVTVDNVAKSAYLVTNKTTHADTRDGVSGNGAYYDSYTENQDNAGKTGLNVINVSGKVDSPSQPAGQWAYEGYLYLPERYAADSQTTIKIAATVTDAYGQPGNVRCAYTIPLGGHDGDEDSKELPRGTYYEVIAKIKSLGEAELDATIIAKDWEDEYLPVEMVHTYLTLSKTEASVKSLEDDFITYDTDGRGDVEFDCTTLLPANATTQNPAVIAIFDNIAKKITFKVNPAVDITTLPESEQIGTADCYITAGNIRKLVQVHYDIKPFFIITPLELKIQWNTEYEGRMNAKIYEYSTNLGGIRITTLAKRDEVKISRTRTGGTDSYTDNVANSNLKLEFATEATYSQGQIEVTALNDPLTTTYHYFSAYPEAPGYDNLKEDLQVTVMPPLGDYRIYFRAINDYIHYNGGTSTSEFLYGNYNSWPAEDYNSYSSASSSRNWNDWWQDDTSTSIANTSHRIYIYTQMGETLGTTTPGSWHFTAGYGSTGETVDGITFPAPYMTGDNTNPGWYYYDLAQNQTSTLHNNERKTPEPGKTLMIFYAYKNGKLGYEPHRASHHLDPGLSLFDFEDREGWFVYDPTSEPYYRVYDDKPYMEDVTFTVYSTQQVTGWWHTYGVAENEVTFNDPQQWTIKYTLKSSDWTTEYINGKTYYVTKIKLKCPHGDYEKAIKLTGLTPGSSMPEAEQYVYYCANGSNPYNPPYIYLWNSPTDNNNWSNTPQMDYWKVENGVTWYRYKIPSQYANGQAIIKRYSGDVTGNDNQTADSPALNNKSWVNYGDNRAYWTEYSSQPSTGGSGVMLFGGRSFASSGHVGTYENGVWKAGKPQ